MSEETRTAKPYKGSRSLIGGKPFEVRAWFAKLDEYRDEPFMPDGRQQPSNPPARKAFGE